MVILHIHKYKECSISSRVKSNSLLFSFVVLFFTILLLLLLSCSIRYCISGPNSRTVLASSTTMGNGERTREGEKDHSLYNHSYQKETYEKKKFNVQCTRIFSHMPHLVNGQQRIGRTSFSVISSIGGKSNDTVHK